MSGGVGEQGRKADRFVKHQPVSRDSSNMGCLEGLPLESPWHDRFSTNKLTHVRLAKLRVLTYLCPSASTSSLVYHRRNLNSTCSFTVSAPSVSNVKGADDFPAHCRYEVDSDTLTCSG